MAIPPGSIPSPHEPFTNKEGVMTRTWYRVIAALTKNSGALAQPILVKPNSFFLSGDLNSGGTLEPATIPTGSLLGNSSGSAADATPQGIDTSLSLNGGKLGLARLAPISLLGNAGATEAIPSGLSIGPGFTIVGGNTLAVQAATPGGLDLAGAQTLSWWRG